MLIHIVCFKYKAETGDAARRDHIEKLHGLETSGIPGILSLTVGVDVVHSARSYDTALIARFPDRAALETYQKHPQHVPVAQHGAGLCEHIVAVDFED